MPQLYGKFGDYLSFANVSRAIANELVRKRFDVTIFSINSLYPKYVDVYADVGLRTSDPIGICVSYPESSSGWLEGHAFKVLVTVCETDRIPQSWVASCNFCDLVVVPSQWCYDAFVRSGVKTPVLIVRHGIYANVAQEIRALPKRNDYLLHVSGSLSFAARKGTSKLLRAYKEADENHLMPPLWLKMPNTSGVKQVIDSLELGEKIKLLPDDSLSPREMYTLCRNAVAIVQPSRAEGFGIVPLEGRCVGTQAIITNTTGHAEHYVEGVDNLIPSKFPMAPLETQANPVGSAPRVREQSIYDNIIKSVSKSSMGAVQKWAEDHAEEWDWSRVLTPLVRELKLHKTKKGVKLGGGASLRGIG